MSDTLRELYKLHSAALEKYVYFQLAGAGAAIAFAVTRTHDEIIGWGTAFVAAAVVSWGFSFFFGCMGILQRVSHTRMNFELLQLEHANHPFTSEARQLTELEITKSANYLDRQFRWLILGAVLYILWHSWEMYLRTFYRTETLGEVVARVLVNLVKSTFPVLSQ